MPDLVLAIAHHLAVFTLVALFAAEFALLRPGLEGRRLEQLGAIDRAYGGVAGLVIVIGIIRVIFGSAGWEFYLGNWAFWLKLAAFLAMGLLSIKPTMDISAGARPLPAPPVTRRQTPRSVRPASSSTPRPGLCC